MSGAVLLCLALLFPLGFLSRKVQSLEIEVLGLKPAFWLSAPGTVLHELSHYLACLLTGVKVEKLVLFSPQAAEGGKYTLGYLRHQTPGFWGRLLIGPAPFFGVSGVFCLLLFWLLPGFQPGGGIFSGLRSLFFRLDFTSAPTWLLVYLALALLPGASPSREDWRDYSWGWLLLLLGGLALPFFNRGRLGAMIAGFFSFLNAGLVLSLGGLALAWGFLRLLKLLKAVSRA